MIDKKSASFIQSLCMGEIEEEIVLPFPRMKEGERETVEQVISSVDSLLSSKEKAFREWDQRSEMPREFIDEMKSFGLFGLVIPEEHGGMGFGSAAYSRVLQEISKFDASVALTIGAHSSIGMRGLLLFGTAEQRSRWLPKLASGEMIAAFCLTEPGAGSDAASVKTTALRSGDDWILNGEKLWITNGGIADFFTVFAKTPEVKKDGKALMTAFIVTRDMPGVTTGPHEDKMGTRANSTTTVHFEDVKLPADHVLGEVGKGFKAAMSILNAGRTGLGGGSVGGMKRLIALATKQAKERVQFGQPIASYGLVKSKIGQMVVDAYSSEAMVRMVAGLIDQGYADYAVEAAASKIYSTECLWRTVDEALQVAGGNGYMREFPYERVMRDCRINRIFEGTNEILRLFVALSAMNRVGGQLKELASSLKGIFDDPIKGFGVLSEYALKQASLVTGVTAFGAVRRTFSKLDPALAAEGKTFEEGTRDLATAADRVLRKHGKSIIGKQFATRRLADMIIDLFALACTLSRVDAALKEKGREKAAREVEIAKVLASQVHRRVRSNFHQIDDNVDELVKSLADDAVEREGFAWDAL